MLENLNLQQIVEGHGVIGFHQFSVQMMLAVTRVFRGMNHLRFLEEDFGAALG